VIESLQDWEVVISRVPGALLRCGRLHWCEIAGMAGRTRRETLGRVDRYALWNPG